jgi:hypothetical protein
MLLEPLVGRCFVSGMASSPSWEFTFDYEGHLA